MTGARTAAVSEAVDGIGHGRSQRRLLAVRGVTWAADAAEVLLIGSALPSVRRPCAAPAPARPAG